MTICLGAVVRSRGLKLSILFFSWASTFFLSPLRILKGACWFIWLAISRRGYEQAFIFCYFDGSLDREVLAWMQAQTEFLLSNNRSRCAITYKIVSSIAGYLTADIISLIVDLRSFLESTCLTRCRRKGNHSSAAAGWASVSGGGLYSTGGNWKRGSEPTSTWDSISALFCFKNNLRRCYSSLSAFRF